MQIDSSLALRAALVQAALVAALAIVLALALPHSFFEDWGFLAGPGAWIACAAATASILRLAIVPALAGAALAGIPSGLATVVGAHWAGAVVAVGVFGLWCGAMAMRGLRAEAA